MTGGRPSPSAHPLRTPLLALAVALVATAPTLVAAYEPGAPPPADPDAAAGDPLQYAADWANYAMREEIKLQQEVARAIDPVWDPAVRALLDAGDAVLDEGIPIARAAACATLGTPPEGGCEGLLQEWVAREDVGPDTVEVGEAAAVSPDGARLYVAGWTMGAHSYRRDYLTVAYDAATGARLWSARYNGPAHVNDWASAVVVSPDGATIHVAGISSSLKATCSGNSCTYTGGHDLTVVAYDAATGAEKWVSRNPGQRFYSYDHPWLAVSGDGARLFLAGEGDRGGASAWADMVHVHGLDAATGARLWSADIGNATGEGASIHSMAATPDGSRILVSGGYTTSATGSQVAVTAVDGATGAQVWRRTFPLAPSPYTSPRTLAVDPTGARAYFASTTIASVEEYTRNEDILVAALDVASGNVAWSRVHNGTPRGDEQAIALAVAGDRVVVAAESALSPAGFLSSANRWVTLAYDAATGEKAWEARYVEDNLWSGGGRIAALAASPDGSRVYATGVAYTSFPQSTGNDYLTVAYDAASGLEAWRARYDTPHTAYESYGRGNDEPTTVVVGPSGDRIYVTGLAGGTDHPFDTPPSDAVTVAYAAEPRSIVTLP